MLVQSCCDIEPVAYPGVLCLSCMQAGGRRNDRDDVMVAYMIVMQTRMQTNCIVKMLHCDFECNRMIIAPAVNLHACLIHRRCRSRSAQRICAFRDRVLTFDYDPIL